MQDDLLKLWRTRVDAKYLYRGMSAKDLANPLDPSHDPFERIRAGLHRLLDLLQRLLDDGSKFTVHEDYSGLSFDLRDIVCWTRGDLNNPGIDFTSLYEHACGYAQNFQGSQLKQNLRYITNHLPERKSDAHVQSLMVAKDWELVSRINTWVLQESSDHRRVVLWVRRSCAAFESTPELCAPLGTFEYFRQNVLTRMESDGLPRLLKSVERMLPRESDGFCFRLMRPLRLDDIDRIEEIGQAGRRP